MKRRELTESEKQAREDRRAQFREIARQVAALSDTQRADLSAEMGAVRSCLGHELSLNNSILCWFQNPAATVVGGFRQWKSLGRYVRKGERAIGIYIPKGKRSSDGAEKGDAEPSAVDLASESESSGSGRSGFIVGSVFDISQTEACEAELEGRAAA